MESELVPSHHQTEHLSDIPQPEISAVIGGTSTYFRPTSMSFSSMSSSSRSDNGSDYRVHGLGLGSCIRGHNSNDGARGRHDDRAVPGRGETASRRNSMAIRNMLNPSDSDNRGYRSPSQSTLSGADDIGSSAHTPRAGRSSHRSGASSAGGTQSSTQSHSPSASSHTSLSSRSSLSPEVPARTRTFRPAYDREEIFFIWFHRIDLGCQWDEVLTEYTKEFPGAARDKSGLQCKFYRILRDYQIPKMRDQSKYTSDMQRYGMWANTRLRYKWMQPHANLLRGKATFSMNQSAG